MTFFSLRPASAPIAPCRERYHSAGDATVSFWASSLRSALVSQNGAAAHQSTHFLGLATRTTSGDAIDAAKSDELERWDLLSALDESSKGPPTAVQLALLDHLAPPDTPWLTH